MVEYDALTRNFICDFTDAPSGVYKRKVNDKWLVPEIYAYNMRAQHIKEELISIDKEELLSNSVSVVPEAYQIIGAKWLLKSGRNLGDATGLGKTVQVLLAYEHMRLKGDITHLLVFCPKRAILTWEREYEKHLGRKPDATVMIINYDQVKSEKGFNKIRDFLRGADKLYVNIDEIHNLAGISSKRFLTLDCLLTGRRNTHITSTTATFIRNRTPSFYAPYRLLRGADITASLFSREFYNENTRKPKNLPALKELFSLFSIGRTLEDVNISLPRKNIEVIKVGMSQKQKEVYKEVGFKVSDLFAENQYLAGISRQLSACSHPCVWEEYKMFENIAVNKMKLLDELLEEIGDIPVAVWSKHPNVLARIAETYPERLPIVLDGTLSEKEFNSLFMSFLQGDSKLLCLSLGACNQSMDGIQHRCHNNIFFDLSWKPTEFIQSQGRTHRRGQSKLTNFYYLVYKDTLDETVYNMLQEKITHARNVEDLDKDMYDDLVQTIQKRGKLK